MAPRTRSNRAQPFANLTVSGHEEPYNTKGLVGLPDELLLEIASHIPSMPLPTRYPLKGEPELEGYQARHMTFASLTQTCRSLRRVFLKHLWQRIEVVDGMQTPTGPLPVSAVRSRLRPKNVKSRLFSRELVRQLEIVTIREPRLAQHVREMNIVLVLDDESAKWDTVLQELAKRAAEFTNLRTVQLVFNNRVPSFQVRKLLKKYKYPQVTTLSISYPFNNIYRDAEEMRHLLASCPGLRHLAPAMDALCLNSIFDSPSLEVVGPLFFRKRYAEKLLNSKNLRDISIHSDNFIDRTWDIEYLAPLRELKYLHTIRIGVHEEISTRFLEDYSDKLQRWVEYCRWLLSGRPKPGNGEVQVKKQVLVMFYSESGKRRVETHDVDACQ